MEIKRILFLSILFIAVWNDWKTKTISRNFLMLSSGIGIGVCLAERRDFCSIVLSLTIGIGILGLSRCTRGGIGEGDGWFFIVMGLFLNLKETCIMFLSGMLFCFLVSLPIAFVGMRKKQRKITLPFLPFLLPFGIWIVTQPVFQ